MLKCYYHDNLNSLYTKDELEFSFGYVKRTWDSNMERAEDIFLNRILNIEKSLETLANTYNITRERIRQIEHKIARRVSSYLQRSKFIYDKEKEIIPDILEINSWEALECSVRIWNMLRNEKIKIGDLINKQDSDLLRIPNFGIKSLRELDQALSLIGLKRKEKQYE